MRFIVTEYISTYLPTFSVKSTCESKDQIDIPYVRDQKHCKAELL